MRIKAIAMPCVAAVMLMTASPAQAELTAQPALSPTPIAQTEPRAEVQDLLQQISELDDQWNSLTPAQRNQRIAGLQQQVTQVQNDVQNLPPGQQLEVEGMLGMAVMRLANILNKERTTPPG
jgi:hypothetical protein